MTALPTPFNWSSAIAPALAGIGQGLMAAGSRQGWSAFGPAFSAGIQDFQRMQGARQQAEREQERYDEWKRQTDEQRADRERLQQQWDDWAKSQPGLMQTASQDGQPVTAAGGIGPGLMNGVVPVAGHGG